MANLAETARAIGLTNFVEFSPEYCRENALIFDMVQEATLQNNPSRLRAYFQSKGVDYPDKLSFRYSALPHKVLQSQEYRDLSASERSVLIEILRRYDGKNNGFLNLANRRLSEDAKTSGKTTTKALEKFRIYGWIQKEDSPKWKGNQRMGDEYSICWYYNDRTYKSPTYSLKIERQDIYDLDPFGDF